MTIKELKRTNTFTVANGTSLELHCATSAVTIINFGTGTLLYSLEPESETNDELFVPIISKATIDVNLASMGNLIYVKAVGDCQVSVLSTAK